MPAKKRKASSKKTKKKVKNSDTKVSNENSEVVKNKELVKDDKLSPRLPIKVIYSVVLLVAILLILWISSYYLHGDQDNLDNPLLNGSDDGSDNFSSTSNEVVIGDKISVFYTGRLQDGEVFDTNIKEIAEKNNLTKKSYSELEFIAGTGQMIEGFDNAVIGMKPGESKTITINPEEAYGPYKADLVKTLTPEEFNQSFPNADNISIGKEFVFKSQDGRLIRFTIKNIGQGFIMLDFNHRLAGEELIFDIKLVSKE